MSAADEWADRTIKQFGPMPRSEDFYRAILSHAFSSGQVHQAARGQQKLDEAFRVLDRADAAKGAS